MLTYLEANSIQETEHVDLANEPLSNYTTFGLLSFVEIVDYVLSASQCEWPLYITSFGRQFWSICRSLIFS